LALKCTVANRRLDLRIGVRFCDTHHPICDLRWDQVEFASGALHVRRVKRGTPSTHPILGDELRALRRLQREQQPASPFVFISERGSPFSTAGQEASIASTVKAVSRHAVSNCPNEHLATLQALVSVLLASSRNWCCPAV